MIVSSKLPPMIVSLPVSSDRQEAKPVAFISQRHSPPCPMNCTEPEVIDSLAEGECLPAHLDLHMRHTAIGEIADEGGIRALRPVNAQASKPVQIRVSTEQLALLQDFGSGKGVQLWTATGANHGVLKKRGDQGPAKMEKASHLVRKRL